MIDVQKASAELSTKTLAQIQEETAFVWASRALAAYQFYRSSGDPHWLLDAEEYCHEAIEHAALIGTLDVLQAVQVALAPYRS